MGDGAEDNDTHSQTQRLAQVTWALQGNARVTDVFHRTSMRIIRKCDTTKHWILFQEDEVQYEDMMPIVNPGQSCNDFSAIWRFVPRTCVLKQAGVVSSNHGDVEGWRHAISRTVSSSSASIQEVPARDGGCRQTSPAIETCALRFIAQGVRPTFGGPPTTVITSNESGAVAETETSCTSKLGSPARLFDNCHVCPDACCWQ